MKQGRHFLGGKGSRKPLTPIEKLIRQAHDSLKTKQAAANIKNADAMLAWLKNQVGK